MEVSEPGNETTCKATLGRSLDFNTRVKVVVMVGSLMRGCKNVFTFLGSITILDLAIKPSKEELKIARKVLKNYQSLANKVSEITEQEYPHEVARGLEPSGMNKSLE